MKTIIYLLLLIYPAFGFSIEASIPQNSQYFVLKTDQKINDITYKLIASNFKFILYPSGNKQDSPVYKMISTLKNNNIQNIEVFTNKKWGTLVKLEKAPIKLISKLLISVLESEQFSPVGITNSSSSITIKSSSEDFQGSQVYIQSINNNCFIFTDPLAIKAWKTKTTHLPFLPAIKSLFKNPKMLGFSYVADKESPYYITFSAPSDKTLSANIIYPHKNNPLQDLTPPRFIPDNPLVLLTLPKKALPENINISTVLPNKALQTLLSLAEKTNYKSASFIMNSGNIYAINEKKYDALEVAFIINAPSISILKQSILDSSQLKIRHSALNQNLIYRIESKGKKTSLEALPVFAVFYKEKIIFSLNKNFITKLNNNILNKKSSLLLNGIKNTSNIDDFIDINNTVNKFSFLNFFFGQYGIDITKIKDFKSYTPKPFEQLFIKKVEISLN